MIRAYICPVIGAGTKANPYRSKGADFGYQSAAFIPGSPPSSTWALTVLIAPSFTTIDADATCDDLFQGDLPAGVNTAPEVRGYLRGRTVTDVPLARRNAIMAVLDKYGVNRADFVGTTPLWRVLQRVTSTLFGATFRELDSNFPAF